MCNQCGENSISFIISKRYPNESTGLTYLNILESDIIYHFQDHGQGAVLSRPITILNCCELYPSQQFTIVIGLDKDCSLTMVLKLNISQSRNDQNPGYNRVFFL